MGRRGSRRATRAVQKRMTGPYSLGPRHSRRVGPQGARGAVSPKLWSQVETTTQRRENTHPSHLRRGKGPPSLRTHSHRAPTKSQTPSHKRVSRHMPCLEPFRITNTQCATHPGVERVKKKNCSRTIHPKNVKKLHACVFPRSGLLKTTSA